MDIPVNLSSTISKFVLHKSMPRKGYDLSNLHANIDMKPTCTLVIILPTHGSVPFLLLFDLSS